MDNDDFLMIIF